MMSLIRCLPLLLLPAACVIPIGGAEVGDLRVTWSFVEGGAASQICSQVGVDNVTIQLVEKGSAGGKAFGQTAECIAGSMVIPDVVAGTYLMTAVGEGEVALFSNGEGVTVTVAPNTLTDAAAELELQNGEVVARVDFRFVFDGDASCSANDVQTINAQVVGDEGQPIAGSTTDCIAGLGTVEGIRVGENLLKLEAVDGDGNVRFVGEKALNNLKKGEALFLGEIAMERVAADLEVAFSFGGQSCAEAGVDNVDVQLLQENGEGDTEVVAAQNVQCIDGRVAFDDMPLGLYTVHIDAVDGNDEVLFTTEDDVAFDVQKDVATHSVAIDLDAQLATVIVRFELPAGLTCAEANIDNVDVQIATANAGATGTNVNCIDGDSGELVVAAGPGADISVDAISGDDVTFHGESTETLDSGDQVITIELEAVRSTLLVSWDFSLVSDPNVVVAGVPPADTTTSCIEADVDTVIVRVFRGAVLEIAQAVDCDEGRVEMAGIGVGNVRVEVEGIREQDGDAPFFRSQNVAVAGARTEQAFTLDPALVFVFIVWSGDCGVAEAATVDVQIEANGINTGVNMPCAQGSQKVALPRNSEDGNVTIRLRGVDGQGAPNIAQETIGPVQVVPGINTFRFAGPT